MSEELGQENEQQSDAALRSAAFADEMDDREIVVHKGHRYEVRAPTIEQQKAATLASRKAVKRPDGKPLVQNGRTVTEVDSWEQSMRILVACTYNPSTGNPVFTRADLDGLVKKSAGKNSLLAALTKALKNVTTVEEEAVEAEAGNSDGDPTATPSTP